MIVTTCTGKTHDTANLPMWAQDHINDLERKLKEATARAEEAQLATSPDESDAVLAIHHDYHIGLGKHPVINFKMGPEWWNAIQIRKTGDNLLSVSSIGAHRLYVRPQATNTIEVEINPGR